MPREVFPSPGPEEGVVSRDLGLVVGSSLAAPSATTLPPCRTVYLPSLRVRVTFSLGAGSSLPLSTAPTISQVPSSRPHSFLTASPWSPSFSPARTPPPSSRARARPASPHCLMSALPLRCDRPASGGG